MTEEIQNLLIALVPSIVGILGIVGSVLTCISKIKSLTNSAEKEAAELRRRIAEYASVNADLHHRYDDMLLTLTDLRKDIEEATACKMSEIQAIHDQEMKFLAQSEEIKQLTAELKRVKAQLKALLKEE